MTAQPAGELFSHPDTDEPGTMPGPPNDDQRSYVNLFREPADVPENAEEAV